MSEFADDLQHQNAKQKQVAPTSNETSASTKRGPAQPNDTVLTSWLGDVCSGDNPPFVCEAAPKAEPVRAPFNIPVPIGKHVVPPPRAMNWEAVPAVATCPTEMITGGAAFKPQYQAENLEPYKGAFASSWNEVRDSYNGLVTLHRAYRDKEKDVIPILQVDASRPVGAGVQGIDAAKSFVGGKLKPSLTKLDSSKLSPEFRAQIFKARDKTKATELDIASKRDHIEIANASLVQASNAVETASNRIDLAKIETEIENLQLDKEQIRRDVENLKAKAKAIVETVKLTASIINCWSDPQKLFGNVIAAVGQGATAGGAIAEAVYTVDANAKLANLDGQIRSLKNYRGGLLLRIAQTELSNALIDVEKKVNEVKIAVRAMEASKLAHQDAYRDMGALIEKAGATSGLNPKERTAVAGAVEAVPKIETIQEQLQSMDEGLFPPPYNEASGIGAAMASNIGVFTHALSVIKGNREYVVQLKALWAARRASVLAVVDKAVSVTGDE